MLVLHRSILGKHVIKLLNDFRTMQKPGEKENMRPGPIASQETREGDEAHIGLAIRAY
jgi:hypothetical protein